MSSLKNLLRAAKNDLPITVRHERWLTKNTTTYSPEALNFAAQALGNEVGGGRNRRRLFRASGMGGCLRQRVFTYLGVPGQKEITSGLSNIFHTGHFLHLKWQLAGLTEGWLSKAEVPVENEPLLLGGTMDGILYDDSGFEFKTINSWGFKKVHQDGPKPEHVLQTHAYMLMTEMDAFSVVYENKDTAEWREFRVRKDPTALAKVQEELDTLHGSLDRQELPPVLPACAAGEGMQFRNCPFRLICVETKEWPV